MFTRRCTGKETLGYLIDSQFGKHRVKWRCILIKDEEDKALRSPVTLFTCHHLLGLVWLHVTVILSCHFFRAGLRAASLLCIKRVRVVLEDNELQKKRGKGWGGGTQGKVRRMEEDKQQTAKNALCPSAEQRDMSWQKWQRDRYSAVGPGQGHVTSTEGGRGDNRRKA